MKKNFLRWMPLLCLAILCIGFVSCGDDDDEKSAASSPIVGVWRCEVKNTSFPYYCQYMFLANGTYSYTEEAIGDEPDYGGIDGTWKLVGNKVILTDDEGDPDGELIYADGKLTEDWLVFTKIS